MNLRIENKEGVVEKDSNDEIVQEYGKCYDFKRFR